jgi:NADH:ubiquinone oxidoreductase subunit 4 (subunit M)
VEAPTSGSVVLAGLLLKVGLYGLFKVAVLTGATLHTASVCCVIGMVLSPILSMFSRDSKKLLAYSRVSHINLVVYGVNVLSSMTMSGGTLVGLGHGYISSGLFYLVGTLYANSGTRQVYYLLGVSSSCGMVAGCSSALSMANGGIPPFMSFWGEIITFMSMFSSSRLTVFPLFLYFMLVLYYSLYLILHLTKYGNTLKVRSFRSLYLCFCIMFLMGLPLVFF